MKEYFPEQYQRELEMEEMIKEMTYDPEVEALEAEIKAMRGVRGVLRPNHSSIQPVWEYEINGRRHI